MPRNLKEELIFSTIIEIIMCTGMTVYNTILAFTLYNVDHKVFMYQDFLAMMGGFLLSFIIVFILGWFVTKLTPALAAMIWKHKPNEPFRNIHHERMFIYTMITLTVVIMCTTMSCLATIMYNDRVHADWSKFGNQFLNAWWHNALLAFPLQIIVCQPIAKIILKKYRFMKK